MDKDRRTIRYAYYLLPGNKVMEKQVVIVKEKDLREIQTILHRNKIECFCLLVMTANHFTVYSNLEVEEDALDLMDTAVTMLSTTDREAVLH